MFNFTDDFNNEIHDHITKLFERSAESAEQRVAAADQLIESYYEVSGKVPPPSALERLGSYIMREDYEDKRKNKSQKTEYPTLSERQQARRYEKEATFGDIEYVSSVVFGTKKSKGDADGGLPIKEAIHPATIPNTTTSTLY